ncbi:MAG: hypothetical protein AB7I24_08245 [Candidatus Nanopelagicales bacterium]|jgi:hypothetical protein
MPPRNRTTGKTTRTRISLEAWKAEQIEESGLEIEAADRVFVIPPIQVWPDGASDALIAGRVADACRIVMGDEDYQAFVDAGGSGTMLASMLEQVHGASTGE